MLFCPGTLLLQVGPPSYPSPLHPWHPNPLSLLTTNPPNKRTDVFRKWRFQKCHRTSFSLSLSLISNRFVLFQTLHPSPCSAFNFIILFLAVRASTPACWGCFVWLFSLLEPWKSILKTTESLRCRKEVSHLYNHWKC